MDECIIWPGARNEKGYGLISDRLSTGERRAHRAACRIFHGPPPDGRPHALHLCGKGHEGCVTPSHLYWGTPAMNSADAVAHGTIVSGSDNNFAILTEADINPIRRDQRPVPEIAERYGVTKWAIYDIKNGRNWKHVPWE